MNTSPSTLDTAAYLARDRRRKTAEIIAFAALFALLVGCAVLAG